MNNIITIDKIENSGVVHFTFHGEEDLQDIYKVSIVDENTNLTVHRSLMRLKNGVPMWISTGHLNAQRLKNVKLTLIMMKNRFKILTIILHSVLKSFFS